MKQPRKTQKPHHISSATITWLSSHLCLLVHCHLIQCAAFTSAIECCFTPRDLPTPQVATLHDFAHCLLCLTLPLHATFTTRYRSAASLTSFLHRPSFATTQQTDAISIGVEDLTSNNCLLLQLFRTSQTPCSLQVSVPSFPESHRLLQVVFTSVGLDPQQVRCYPISSFTHAS
ncbi:hypothetical protein GGR57DRAFT_471752 [Xylariaceae sp. FL1272]|nr:hypothetical protein GGR57DRAFT_471752 [Xylariaceae sp. FL1272]